MVTSLLCIRVYFNTECSCVSQIMGGIEATGRLRAFEQSQPNLAKGLVIGMSADSDQDTKTQAYAAGKAPFLLKM